MTLLSTIDAFLMCSCYAVLRCFMSHPAIINNHLCCYRCEGKKTRTRFNQPIKPSLLFVCRSFFSYDIFIVCADKNGQNKMFPLSELFQRFDERADSVFYAVSQCCQSFWIQSWLFARCHVENEAAAKTENYAI